MNRKVDYLRRISETYKYVLKMKPLADTIITVTIDRPNGENKKKNCSEKRIQLSTEIRNETHQLVIF